VNSFFIVLSDCLEAVVVAEGLAGFAVLPFELALAGGVGEKPDSSAVERDLLPETAHPFIETAIPTKTKIITIINFENSFIYSPKIAICLAETLLYF
jgi:hypothetical protein